jgi:hypothetical protein
MESAQVGGGVIYTVNVFALFYKQGPNVGYIDVGMRGREREKTHTIVERELRLQREGKLKERDRGGLTWDGRPWWWCAGVIYFTS